MCQAGFRSRTAPLTESHIAFLADHLPQDADLIVSAGNALTEGLNPHANTLALIGVMAKHHREGRRGLAGSLWGDAVRFPLSVVTPEDGVRHRTPLLEEMHASVLSLNMSQGTMERLDAALAPRGLACRMMCSCGVVLLRRDRAARFSTDPNVLAMDRFRSMLDGLGMPVLHIASSHDIPVQNMDWTDDELALHDELDALIALMARTVVFDEAAFLRKAGFSDLAQQMTATIERARSFHFVQAA